MRALDAAILLVIGLLILPFVLAAGLLIGVWVGFTSAAGL